MPHPYSPLGQAGFYGTDADGTPQGPTLGGVRLSPLAEYPGVGRLRVHPTDKQSTKVLYDLDEEQYAAWRRDVESLAPLEDDYSEESRP
jgi:hypothetical protein